MLQYGADVIFDASTDLDQVNYLSEDIATLVERGEEKAQKLSKELENQLKKKNLVDFE